MRRTFYLLVAGVFALAAFLVGAREHYPDGGNCGSVFSPGWQSHSRLCESALGSSKTIVLLLIIAAVVAAFIPLFIRGDSPKPEGRVQKIDHATGETYYEDVPAEPKRGAVSLAGELSELAELHRAGALSDGEYAAAKARVLGKENPGGS